MHSKGICRRFAGLILPAKARPGGLERGERDRNASFGN